MYDPAVALGLTLREQPEVGHLGAHEQHPRRVGARRDTGAAADAGRRVERPVGVVLRDEDAVRVRRSPVFTADEPAGLDDPVERRAVDDEVLEHRERSSPATARW